MIVRNRNFVSDDYMTYDTSYMSTAADCRLVYAITRVTGFELGSMRTVYGKRGLNVRVTEVSHAHRQHDMYK